jgi:hypothetical protein
MVHEELAGYFQLSVKVNAAVIVDWDPAPPSPCLLPDAIVCGVVETLKNPEVQLPVAPEPSPRLVH